jgi:hypothetical protein
MLTSRGSRIALAVFSVLFGVFQIAYANASGHHTAYIVRGLFWLAFGVFWGFRERKARR